MSKISYEQALKMNLKKVCTKCKRELPINCFHKCLSGRYGVKGRCKECRKDERQDYYKKNKWKEDKQHKKYYETEQGKKAQRKANINYRASQNKVFSYSYDLDQIKDAFPVCCYTGKEFVGDMTLEHIIAISKGGSNTP